MTSNPPASMGKRILLMETCSSWSCPATHGHQSIDNLIEFLCVRSQGLGRDNATVKRTRHCSKQWLSVSRLEQVVCIPSLLHTSVRSCRPGSSVFCSLSLVGSWIFRAVVVISVRYSASLAVHTIIRPLDVHLTNCVISSRIVVVLS